MMLPRQSPKVDSVRIQLVDKPAVGQLFQAVILVTIKTATGLRSEDVRFVNSAAQCSQKGCQLRTSELSLKPLRAPHAHNACQVLS